MSGKAFRDLTTTPGSSLKVASIVEMSLNAAFLIRSARFAGTPLLVPST